MPSNPLAPPIIDVYHEYSDFVNEDGESIEFDSYMIPDSDLEDGQLRLASCIKFLLKDNMNKPLQAVLVWFENDNSYAHSYRYRSPAL